MKKFLLVTMCFAYSQTCWADAIWTKVQCLADGLELRQTGGEKFPVHSRLNISIEETEAGATLRYIGHLEIGRVWDDKGEGYRNSDYYGHFFSERHESSLSPRARRYTDAEYYRFREFKAINTTAQDGGGMWGYLVVSKKYFDNSEKTFPAHYVFQSGDHMGGTVDYECERY